MNIKIRSDKHLLILQIYTNTQLEKMWFLLSCPKIDKMNLKMKKRNCICNFLLLALVSNWSTIWTGVQHISNDIEVKILMIPKFLKILANDQTFSPFWSWSFKAQENQIDWNAELYNRSLRLWSSDFYWSGGGVIKIYPYKGEMVNIHYFHLKDFFEIDQ